MSWENSTTPPGVVNYNTAPSNTAPGVVAPPAKSNTAPGVINPPAASTTAPAELAPAELTDQPPASIPWGEAGPDSVPSMSSTFTPAFINLSGGGPTLRTLTANAADAAAGRIVQGTVNGKIKNYQVRVGTDAETASGSIVHPVNYDPDTNAVVFVIA